MEPLNLCTCLHHLLAAFCSIQATYMPSVTAAANSPSVWTSSASVPAQETKWKCRVDTISSDDDKPNPTKERCGMLSVSHILITFGCSSTLNPACISMRLAMLGNGNKTLVHHPTLSQNNAKIKVFQDKYNMARVAPIALGADEAMLEWRKVKNGDL